jgi:hypothetical protein
MHMAARPTVVVRDCEGGQGGEAAEGSLGRVEALSIITRMLAVTITETVGELRVIY